MKVACYIDGFNLYHAIDALARPNLKWIDLAALAQSYVRPGETLVRTVFFTALNTWDKSKRQRHVNYINALEHTGVTVCRSKFDPVQKWCERHERWCRIREEKQTDVSIAVEMLSDCYRAGVERIILITADSDQVPVVKAIKSQFPENIVILVAPPKRLSIARELGSICDGVGELTAGRLKQYEMPTELRDNRGKLVAARPASYGDRFDRGAG